MDGGNSYQQMESYSTVGGGENYSQMKGSNHQRADGSYSQAEGSHGYEVTETSGQMSADTTSGTGQGTESRIQNQPSRAQNYNQGGKQQTGKRQQEQTFERKRPRDRSPTNIPYQRRRLEGPPDLYGPEARRRHPFHRSPSPPFPPYDLPPYDPYRRPITPPFDLPPYPPFRRSPSPPFGRPVFPRFRRSPSPPFDLPPGPIRRFRPLPPEFPPYEKQHFPERRPPHSPARPQSQDFSDEVSLLRADGMDSGGKSFWRGKNFSNYQRGSNYRGRRGEYHTERSQRGQTNRGRGFQGGDRGVSHGRGRGTQDTRGRGGSTRGSNNSRGGATQTSTRGSYNQGGSQGGAGSTNQRGAQRGSRGGQRGSRGGQRGVRGTRGAFRGRGGNNLQPSYNKVHSLANVQKPDVKHMSVAEKLHRLGLFLKSDAPGLQINSIQAIENSLLASKLQMKSHYEAMELMKVGGKAMYTGCLYIGGQFIIRSVGPSKKELKHDVYTQALYILTNNSMVDILGRQDRPDELRQSLIESLQQQEQEQQRLAAINPAPVEKNAVSITADPKYQIPCDFNSSVQILMDYLKTKDVFMTNSISGLEEAITASHCLLKTSMTFEESKSSNKSIFRVLLKLGETPVAVGHAPKKKEAKHIAYKNALTALRTRTVDDLADGINPLEGSEPDEEFYKQLLSASSQQSNKTSKKGKLKEAVDGFSLEKQFAKLIDGLKDASFQKNNIPAVDCMAIHLGIHPVSVYRKAEYSENQEPTIACDLYMQDVFVATSESHTKKDAQAETYQKAWDLLLTTPVDKLLQDQPRGPPPDMSDPAVIDIVHKGDGKHGFSNMDRLKQLRIDVYENWKSVDELVIVEHSDWVSDRERHAFCILNQSATKSGLLMEWAIVPTQEERVTFLCTIFLQKQEMGLAKSVTKLRARNLASIIVLNKLYQTQPIIQVLRMDDSKSWITWEEIEEKVKTWIPPAGYVSSLKLLDSPPTDTPLTFSPKVVRYCVYLLDTLLERKTLDVLKFGPGMPKPESRAITNHALQLGLKVEVLQHQGISYMSIGKKLPPSDMVDILRCHNNASGRHLLLMDSQRPTLNITDFPKD